MDYYDLTTTFIEDCERATTLNELATLFHTLVRGLGCTHFVCMSHVNALNPPDDAVVLASYPLEWAKYHSEQGYHEYDPVQLTCRNRITPFTWSNDHWRYLLNKKQVDMLNEASEFGLIEGHTIPIKPMSGYDASVSVVFEKGGVDPAALNALHLIAYYLYEAAIQMKTNETNAEKLANKYPPQRRKILELMAQGKSNWGIGQILNISENTVKDHIRQIYKDLNVSTRTQAVVQGLFQGMIRFQDVQVSSPDNSNETSGFVFIQP